MLSAPIHDRVRLVAAITDNFTKTGGEALADRSTAPCRSASISQTADFCNPWVRTQLRVGPAEPATDQGLLLVFIYSLFQYRLLGFVTVRRWLPASFRTGHDHPAGLRALNYRLSGGVAGLAIGATADSFIDMC